MKRLALGIAVFGTLGWLGVASVHAWDEPICIPSTGEVRQPGSFGSHEAYDAFLRNNPSAFVMGANDKCEKPTPTPSSTPTTTPSPPAAATSVPPVGTVPLPVAQPSSLSVFSTSPQQPGQICAYEPTTQQWEIRPHFGDTLAEGQRWPLEESFCAQDAEVTSVSTTPARGPSGTPSAPIPNVQPGPSPISTLAPTAALPTVISACIETSNLCPLTDELGTQAIQDGLPLWYDAEGVVFFGESCSPPPVIVIPEVLPAPVQIP
jgi:hypothetical protein